MTVTPPREVGTVVINLNTVSWVVELTFSLGPITSRCSGRDQTRHERAAEIEPTFSHAVVKCKSLVAGHGIACGEHTHFSAFASPGEKRARLATVRRVAL